MTRDPRRTSGDTVRLSARDWIALAALFAGLALPSIGAGVAAFRALVELQTNQRAILKSVDTLSTQFQAMNRELGEVKANNGKAHP